MKTETKDITMLKADRKGKNYSSFAAGKLSDLLEYTLDHPRLGRTVKGKLFLNEILEFTGMQVSLNKLPAGVSVPFYHKHKENEELYIFTGGKGQIWIDGDIIDVAEGTCVRIAPEGDRVWRNNSSEDLYYIVIQARNNSLSQHTFEDGLPSERPVVWPD